MLGADLPPGKVKYVWHETCHVPGVQTTVQKANKSAECTRAEFVEILIAVWRITAPALGRPPRPGADTKPQNQQQNQDLLEQWFQEVFFPFCSQVNSWVACNSTAVVDHKLGQHTQFVRRPCRCEAMPWCGQPQRKITTCQQRRPRSMRRRTA